jgi:CDP-diacylglycerol--glycerol-3-phosphate 3-phosphatidyltransferase
VFFGVLIYFLTGPCDSLLRGFDTCSIGPLLAYSAFIGSVMVSYLRARSEGLGIDCKVGIMTRPERVIAVGIGLIISEWISIVILLVLVIITVLGLFTTIQRLVHSSSMLKKSK